MAKVYVEFEEPECCYDCPLFYATEGAFCDRCQLTNEEVEKINIWKEKLKNCPLKKVDWSYEELSKEYSESVDLNGKLNDENTRLQNKNFELKKENEQLKTVLSFEEWLTPEIHAEIMNGYSSAEDKMKLAKKIYERSK